MSTTFKESPAMGRVTTEAVIENSGDLFEVRTGKLAADQVRRVVVPDALIDTGASTLSLPTSMIKELGLYKVATRRVRTAAGTQDANRYSAVKLAIQGRDVTVDVTEVPDDRPVLIGQIPLEFMDFIVDPKNQKLIGNPAHGG